MKSDRLESLLVECWERVRDRYQAYEILRPGDASFICQPRTCDAHCCRRFTVSLGDQETARLRRESGLAPIEFLESSEGHPLTLPLAQPYVLARKDNHCALLGDDLGCSQYSGRPDACRLYPHQVIWVDATTHRRPRAGHEDLLKAVDQFLAGQASQTVPMLVRHIECPGFTGPALTVEEWKELFVRTARLQLEHHG